MKVQFVGVGEAFDETLPNNSQILEWQGARLLIDCGYGVPHQLWKLHPQPDYLDAIYISHRHADHYFGLPSYLVRLAEDGRTREILVLCPEKNVVMEMIEYAYLGVLPKLPFRTIFQEVTPSSPFLFRGATLNFAVSSHPVKNLSISVNAEERKYCYSGDGNINEHTRRLYLQSSLLVHEAYGIESAGHGHARVSDVLQMAREQQVKRVAITHIQRSIRRERRAELDSIIRDFGVDAFIPEPGEIYEI